MEEVRRDFLRFTGLGIAAGASIMIPSSGEGKNPSMAKRPGEKAPVLFDVRTYGAAGDGKTIDTPAINAAIDAAAAAGGGTVVFPAGVYASYSIHLKSLVALYLQQGATILAAPTSYEGMSSGGYDAAEPQGAWEPYQDYGHNHWHNSLIWGEDIHDFGIFGPGLIWGKGLSRGHNENTLPDTTKPGVANKAIALKNCRNVILSDFSTKSPSTT
jgi:polygalacturonase